jgi:hypothetical protein
MQDDGLTIAVIANPQRFACHRIAHPMGSPTSSAFG